MPLASWLRQDLKIREQAPVCGLESPILSNQKSKVFPSSFFVPGWSGESLLSKDALSIKKIIHLLHDDAEQRFRKENFTKKLKEQIFEEFARFIYDRSIHCLDIDTPQSLWDHLQNENSPHKTYLEEFVRLHSFRSIITYLYKLRFALTLEQVTGENFISVNGSINSLIAKLFRQGRHDLITTSLQQNQYNWYSIPEDQKDSLKDLINSLKNLSISELMKLSVDAQALFSNRNKLSCQDSDYSHALSHSSFGLLINLLLINFPQFSAKNFSDKSLHQPDVIPTKFAGTYLKSLCLSHWLAQQHNADKKWYEILCPDFDSDEYGNGHFMRNCHELQFLSFLAEISNAQGFDPVKLITSVMKEKYFQGQQPGFFEQDLPHVEHERLVLTLTNLPSKNAHHSVISELKRQTQTLVRGGYVLVLTSQQLFLPSKSAQLEQLMSKMKLEGIMDFSNLIGKGEIPTYLYIFQKRLIAPSSTQEPCHYFRCTGELKQFSHFVNIVTALETFLTTPTKRVLPFLNQKLDHGLEIQYHLDRLLDGRILHSISEDQKSITHQNFLSLLSERTHYFDYYFKVDQLKKADDAFEQVASTYLAVEARPKFSHFLFVQETSNDQATLSIHPIATLKSRMDEYGTACFQYYGLTPKHSNIPIELIHELFKTPIGIQLVDLAFRETSKDQKSKIKSILLPRFLLFVESNGNTFSDVPHFEHQAEDLESQSASSFENRYNVFEAQLQRVMKDSPLSAISGLAATRKALKKFVENHPKMDGEYKTIFSSPLFSVLINDCQNFKIYPPSLNKEVFVEFTQFGNSFKQELLTDAQLTKEDGHDCLKLFHGQEHVATISADLMILRFAHFICHKVLGSYSVLSLVQQLRLPSALELKGILDEIETRTRLYPMLLNRTSKLINQIIYEQITQ